MITSTYDRTTDYNVKNQYNIDTAGYDYVLVHFIGLSGTVTFLGSNDGGATTGQTTESALGATNWVPIQGTNQASGTAVSSVATGSLIKFQVAARYIQLSGTGAVTKLIIYYAKIS